MALLTELSAKEFPFLVFHSVRRVGILASLTVKSEFLVLPLARDDVKRSSIAVVASAPRQQRRRCRKKFFPSHYAFTGFLALLKFPFLPPLPI